MHRLTSLLFIPLLLLSACSARWRAPAVPEDLTQQVALLDNPAIRTWDHELSGPFLEEVQATLQKGINRQRQETGSNDLPTSHLLALSGGGSYGAFGAGILCGWTTRGDRPEFSIVTGISTGALTAPFAFAGPEHDAELRRVYTTLSTSDLLFFRGMFRAILDESAFDTKPMRRMLEDLIDQDMLRDIAAEYAKGRLLMVGTTNLDADRGVVWNMGLIAKLSTEGHPDARRLFHDVLMASAAIPGAFPPVMLDVTANGTRFQEMHVDGGAKTQVFLYPPSLELMAESRARGIDRKRVAYIIRNGRHNPIWESVSRRTASVARRAVSTLINTQGTGDLFRIYLVSRRDKVEFNMAYIPDTFAYTSQDLFDPVFMTKLFNLGYEAASQPAGYPWSKSPPGWSEGMVQPVPLNGPEGNP
jgi:hypothetical protein